MLAAWVHYLRTELATRMNPSRASVNRLLDPGNASVTLQTLEQAALAIGKKLRVEIHTNIMLVRIINSPFLASAVALK